MKLHELIASMPAPFPWYGGKRRWADCIWRYLGNPTVYLEPFAGSAAVLFRRPTPPGRREVLVDLSGHIVNFWRAVKNDHESVAHYADWPQFHHDLSARHRWLVEWGDTSRERLLADPDWHDAKAAGWWVWGIGIWIGGGWCDPKKLGNTEGSVGQIPRFDGNLGERGVHSMGKKPRTDPKFGDRGVHSVGQMPHIDSRLGAQGVHSVGKMPYFRNVLGNRGVHSAGKRQHISHKLGAQGIHSTSVSITAMLETYAERLRNVQILAGNWRQALGPSVTGHTSTSSKPSVGVLLDPPYRTDTGRNSLLYENEAQSTDVALEALEWAREHGETYRIAYCCHVDDFETPDGWTEERMTFSGIRRGDRRGREEAVLFSPACVQPQQMDIFESERACDDDDE